MVEIWLLENAQKCYGCGRYDWEQEEDPDAWEAGLHLCVFCASVEKLKTQVARERQGLPSDGFKIRLYRGGDSNGSVPETDSTV